MTVSEYRWLPELLPCCCLFYLNWPPDRTSPEKHTSPVDGNDVTAPLLDHAHDANMSSDVMFGSRTPSSELISGGIGALMGEGGGASGAAGGMRGLGEEGERM
jgi:hypothetical protein